MVLKKDEYEKSIRLRKQVFCDEQNFAEDLEVDEYDSPFPRSDVMHIISTNTSGEILGTVRFLKTEAYAKLGRLAVSKTARGQKLGQRLVRHAESVVQAVWGSKHIKLSSQYQVQDFYTKLGYKVNADKGYYLDEGWKHCEMDKDL